MRLIQTDAKVLQPSGYGLSDLFRHGELCGRTCYKSEDRITTNSAKKFIDSIIESGHLSVLEHIPIYLYISNEANLDRPITEKWTLTSFFSHNPYSRVVKKCANCNMRYFITTNYRVIVENSLWDALKYITVPLDDHVLRVTVKFITDIGVTREFNRHRVHSPSEQSTRFCNYSKDKFGNSISIINHSDMGSGVVQPLDFYIENYNRRFSWTKFDWYLFSALASEQAYMNLLSLGCLPQQARRVLNLDTVSELVHTAFLDDWYVFFDKRFFGSTGRPHPDAVECTSKLIREFYDLGLLSSDYINHCREDYNYVFGSYD